MVNPRHEIMLQNTAQGVMAHFLENGKPERKTVQLFGTHILPTAYTGQYMTMYEIARNLRNTNPGYHVSII